MEVEWEKLCYPRLCGLIGEKTSRLSQAMHNAGFLELNLPFCYCAFNITDTEFAVAAMQKLGFRGLSVTIPHKEKVLSLIDFCSAEAKAIGAVNTLINSGSSISGYNTDYLGTINALNEAGFNADGKSVLIFGGGGAARAAVYAMQQLKVRSLAIANRTLERGRLIAEEFSIDLVNYTDINRKLLESVDLFINATPLGLSLAGTDAHYPFDLNLFGPQHTVFEMVTRDTELSIIAAKNGAVVVKGKMMLLFQALEQFKLFTGQNAPRAEMEKALNSHD